MKASSTYRNARNSVEDNIVQFEQNCSLAYLCSEGYCSCPVCTYVRMYVCVCMCVHSYLPPHTLESQERERYQRVHSNTWIVLNFADFPKNALLKSSGVICLPRAAPAS